MTDGARVPSSFDASAALDLLDRARAARSMAYAPYSAFPVGAALLSSDGGVITGVNVENASYGLATCAERTAVVRAIAEGVRGFTAIAIAGPDDNVPCPPCGSCRQILHEVAPDVIVITSTETGDAATTSLRDLLPSAFGPSRLEPPTR